MGILQDISSALGLSGGGSGGERVDATGGDEELLAVRRALEQGKWEAVAERMAAMRDWDRRAHWARQLGTLPKRSAALDAWVQARPRSADALLVRGMHLIVEGWKARGYAVASLTSESAFEDFHRLLTEADEDLQVAASLDPEDPTPLAGRLHLARGLSFDPDVVREIFDEARRRDPLHVAAHQHALWFTTEKWGGSHEAMFSLARGAAAAAPQGHRLHVLVAIAHLELVLALSDEDVAAQSTTVAEARRGARDELRSAARSSVLAPGYRMAPETVEDRNWFAAALWNDQAWAEGDAVFRTLHGIVTEFPWDWFHRKPEAAFRKARRACAERANG